jgi:hypothetical protein
MPHVPPKLLWALIPISHVLALQSTKSIVLIEFDSQFYEKILARLGWNVANGMELWTGVHNLLLLLVLRHLRSKNGVKVQQVFRKTF